MANGLSIVVATRGRVALLEDLLVSLDVARERVDVPTEVIIIDDSSPADADRIRALVMEHDSRYVGFGPSVPAKRNLGVAESQYDIVVFLDSDCLATPDLLTEHLRMYDDPRVGAVAGLLEFTGPDTWFWKVVESSPFVIFFGLPRVMNEVPWTPTANCSVRRDLFRTVGGFDETFPPKPGGEDVDLGLRLTAKKTMRSNPKALVYHQKETWTTPRQMFARAWHYGSADFFLVAKHPELVYPSYPRRVVIYLLMVIVPILLALVTGILPLALLSLAVFVDIFAVALTVNAHRNDSLSIIQKLVLQTLLLNHEAGYAFRCIRQCHPSYVHKQIIYLDGQAIGVTQNGSRIFTIHALTASLMLIAGVLIATLS